MYLLHLTFPSGSQETLSFSTAFERGLWIIALASLPVSVRPEDPPVTPIVECALVPQRVATRCSDGDQ
jgi:hypothetical protein